MNSIPSPTSHRDSKKPRIDRNVLLALAAVFICFGLILYLQHYQLEQEAIEDSLEEKVIPTPDLYGLDTTIYRVESVTIPQGVQFIHLLTQQGIPTNRANQAVYAFDSVFPIRRLRAQNIVRFYHNREDSTIHYGVYRHSPRDYVLMDFRDSARCIVHSGVLPLRRELWAARVQIRSSLWNAMQEAGCRADLAMNLSDILAWSVDFFGLNAGDLFQVVYEREFIHDQEVGVGRILTARYISGKDTVEAFSFPQDSTISYWNRQALSIRKEFLKAPLRFSRISSGFSYNRKHPVLKIVRPHTGIDYAAPLGTPVVALGDGTVVAKGYQSGGGNFVKIRHNSTYTTGYLHLSRFGKGIKQGVRVSQGQIIGYVGSTGMSTGPHLDFRVWRGNTPINPLNLKSPPVAPLDSSQLLTFADTVRRQDSLLALLNNTHPNTVTGDSLLQDSIIQLHIRVGKIK